MEGKEREGKERIDKGEKNSRNTISKTKRVGGRKGTKP